MKLQTGNSFSGQHTRIDKHSFEQSYHLYWEKVFTVCYNNTGEVEVSKEMVQDIYKSLWERREELELQKIENYLLRAAKFKAFEYIRNKISRQNHDQIQQSTHLTYSNCTEEQVLFNNLKDMIVRLVNNLPAQCRRVYKMSSEQGLKTKEIAGQLGISERAVEYHINKATGKLKEALAHY